MTSDRCPTIRGTEPRWASRRWRARLALAIGFAVLPVAPVESAGRSPSPSLRVLDPYADPAAHWYRGQLHMHSTTHKNFVHADSLRDKVERYRDAGFDFACVTDHNFDIRLPGVELPPLPTRDPRVPGILFISGVEVGFLVSSPFEGAPLRQPHVGGVGMDWTIAKGDSLFRLAMTDAATIQGAIDSIRTMEYAPGRPALAILNHPGMNALTDGRLMPSDFRGLSGSAGIEVYNTKWAFPDPSQKAWQHLGTSPWDWLLTHGSGPRWGFATDDAHHYVVGKDFLGGWVLVNADTLSTPAILDAIRSGRFVACVDYAQGASRDNASAVFTELGARGTAIRAASDRPSEFTWWTDSGHCVRRARDVEADAYDVAGWEHWVRVRVRNGAGAAYSQPFYVESPGRDEERWKLRVEADTRLLIHFDEGEGPLAEDASGKGHPLLISPPVVPPPADWLDRGDSTAFRDQTWGGWLPNGVGTSPDETDLDRDRSGYALQAHGRRTHGDIPDPGGRLFRGDAWTIDWIGAIERRTGREQPLFVRETEDGAGRRKGWRIVVAEAGAPEAYRFRSYAPDGTARDWPFGETVATGEVELLSLVVSSSAADGTTVEARVGGGGTWTDRGTDPILDPGSGAEGLAVFGDPLHDTPAVYYRLRELRVTGGARPGEAALADATRLELRHFPDGVGGAR